MSLPKHISTLQVNIITKTMEKLQNLLKKIKPYVKDLLHICEIPDSEPGDLILRKRGGGLQQIYDLHPKECLQENFLLFISK